MPWRLCYTNDIAINGYMLLAIIYGLVSGLLLSFTYLFYRKSFENSHPAIGFFWQAFFGILIWVPFSFFGDISFEGVMSIFHVALISAILSEAFYIYVASKGEFSVTGAIQASYPIYTILFAALFIGERLSFLQLVFVLITIVGSVLASLPRDMSRLKQEINTTKHPLAIFGLTVLSAIAVGFADMYSKPAIDSQGPHNFLLALAIAQPLVAVIYVFSVKEQKRILTAFSNFQRQKMAVYAGFVSALSLVFFWLTFSETLASIASPLTGTTALFIALWGFWLDKEEFYPLKVIGIILTVAGVIGIGFV